METENKTPEKITILVPEKEIEYSDEVMEKINWQFEDFSLHTKAPKTSVTRNTLTSCAKRN